MFRVFGHKGFQIVFENGYEVSVMFGLGNYCEQRSSEFFKVYPVESEHNCENAEVAVYKNDVQIKEFPHVHPGDSVGGWLTPNQVAEIITWAAAQ